MEICEKNAWRDECLTEYFQENFRNVSKEQFKIMNGDLRRKFRDYFRGHGVYIPKSKNIHIYTALAQAIVENLEWLRNESAHAGYLSVLDVATDGGSSTERQTESRGQQGLLTQRVIRQSNLLHLFKAYSDLNEKYSGDPINDSDQIFSLFIERCKQAEVDNEDDRRNAFSIMLAADAKKY